MQIITRRGYQSKSKACKTPASILHVRAPYRLILVGVGVDPIGIFRKQDYSSKKIDTRGGGRDTRHTLDKRTTLRASHISKPSTISPTMKRNLFFHVQWLQWPAVLAALFTKCFMHASQIWSKSIIGEHRQSCYTAFFFFLIFFSTFFVFFRFWTKFVDFRQAFQSYRSIRRNNVVSIQEAPVFAFVRAPETIYFDSNAKR